MRDVVERTANPNLRESIGQHLVSLSPEEDRIVNYCNLVGRIAPIGILSNLLIPATVHAQNVIAFVACRVAGVL